ncbi:MAG: tetratricopeptide repeat protein [Bacteroidetes bacterium]|nr:tetratricopeptide repeat protein [Bacteroidota bacterium]
MKKKLIAGESKIYQYSALLVIIVPFLLYISALRLGFVYFDDDILVLDNYEKLSHLANLGKAFRTDAFFASLSPYYRPLMNVSFMLDAAIGGKSPVMYHFANLVYHLLSCVSLLWLLSLMGFSKQKALIGALVFAVHPMMGHAVLWIPARGDLLVTLFGLLSFVMFLRFLKENKVQYLVAHILCFAGAIFSKESAVLFPVLFVLWLLVKKERVIDRRMLVVCFSWILVLSFWYYLRMITIDQRSDGQQGFASLLRNLPFVPEAVSRFFFPFMLPVTPVFSIAYTIGGILAAIMVTVFIIKMKTRNSLPVILFGAAWFLGFCLPNMFVRLVAANDSFEYLLHRTYLPYVGFLIMLLAICPDKWFELKTKTYNFIIGSMLVILFVSSLVQQKKYRDAISYWGSAIQYAPGKAWFHYYLGRYYFKQKDYLRFEQYLQTADSIKSYPEFKYHLGMVALQDKKDLEKAYAYFKEAFRLGYGSPEAHANFVTLCVESSNEFFQKGSYVKAIARCEEALANDPSNGVVAYNLGLYYVNLGEKERAASMWQLAIRLKPDLSEAYRSLFLYYHYDVKKADSAAWFAREFNKHGGTGNLISP